MRGTRPQVCLKSITLDEQNRHILLFNAFILDSTKLLPLRSITEKITRFGGALFPCVLTHRKKEQLLPAITRLVGIFTSLIFNSRLHQNGSAITPNWRSLVSIEISACLNCRPFFCDPFSDNNLTDSLAYFQVYTLKLAIVDISN